ACSGGGTGAAAASDTPSATAATSLPGDATPACAAGGAGSGAIATEPGCGAPGMAQSIHASPDTSLNSGQSVPWSTSAWVGTAGLASLLTAPASSLPLATTVFGGGCTGAGACCCRQPTYSRQAIARQGSSHRCEGRRNRTGITT